MDNNNSIETEYLEFIKSNPDMKFIVYLRIHPHDEIEKVELRKLSKEYGEFKELNEERVAIFIIQGKHIENFNELLNLSGTQMYISFIQSEEELKESND